MDHITDTSPADTFWVKYNINTGAIQSVRSTEIPQSEDYGVMQSTSPALEKVVKDEIPLKEVTLVWNYELERWDVGEKKEITLKALYGTSIDTIKYNEDPISSLRILINTEKNKAVIKANVNSINKQFGISGSDHIAKKAVDELNYYITKAGDPDQYLGKVQVNPATLFQNKEQTVDLPNVQRFTEWSSVDILTRKIFNSYGYSFVNESNIDINNSTKRFISLVEPLALHHMSMEINKDGLVCFNVSNLTKEDHAFLFRGIGKLSFVICNETPDHWLSTFSIQVDDILDKDRDVIKVSNIDIPENPIFIYKHRQLKINYTGDQR